MPMIPIPTLERPVFFDGQRLTADDLAGALAYERELRWLHNRSLHGWGIVFGLAVVGARGATSVTVSPGFALDCPGREIVLAETAELPVPPVAARSTWFLTASYADDADLTAVERAGACGTGGAVRLLDRPLLRWHEAANGSASPGLELVLATATVRGCRLETDLDLGARRQLAQPRPYVFAGQTLHGRTVWRAAPEGVETTVSTAAAGFLGTPSYQARLAGTRSIAVGGIETIDGFGSVANAGATSFTFRVTLPTGLNATGPAGTGRALNTPPIDVRVLGKDLGWHVVWMGVES
jgi:hypothetical protein